MRSRDRLYMAVMLIGLSPVAFAASATHWGSGWQQPIAAGGPARLSEALLKLAPGGQTVVLDLPFSSSEDPTVSWPAGTRQAALKAVVHQADRTASIASPDDCPGLLIVSDHSGNASPREVARNMPAVTDHSLRAGDPLVPERSAVPVSHVKVAATSKPAPVAKPPSHWVISKGELMSKALSSWGLAHGWTVVWKATDWRAPAVAAIPGEFLPAVRLWARAAIANGAPIRLVEYQGNDTLLVESTIQDNNGF